MEYNENPKKITFPKLFSYKRDYGSSIPPCAGIRRFISLF